MIAPEIIEKLQAGAIVRPNGTVPVSIGTSTVHLRPLSEFDLAQAQALLAGMDVSPDMSPEALRESIGDILRRTVGSIEGLTDLDGQPVPVDLDAEPGQALSLAFCLHLVADVITLSRLNTGLAGKSASPSPLSGTAGPASQGEGAKASAIQASRRRATGRTRRKNGTQDARSGTA